MSLHQLFRACWPLQPSLIKSMIVLLNKKPRVPIGFTMIFDKSFICPCFTVKRTVALLNCWLIKIPSTLAHLITHHRTMLHLDQAGRKARLVGARAGTCLGEPQGRALPNSGWASQAPARPSGAGLCVCACVLG